MPMPVGDTGVLLPDLPGQGCGAGCSKQAELEVQKLQEGENRLSLSSCKSLSVASTSSRKGTSGGYAGEVSRDPDHKEPSEVPGNGKSLKASKQGNERIKFSFWKDAVSSSMGMA